MSEHGDFEGVAPGREIIVWSPGTALAPAEPVREVEGELVGPGVMADYLRGRRPSQAARTDYSRMQEMLTMLNALRPDSTTPPMARHRFAERIEALDPDHALRERIGWRGDGTQLPAKAPAVRS